MLDKLPAPLRHLVIVAGAAFGGDVVRAVVDAQGVTGVAWGHLLTSAVNDTAAAVVVAFGALWLTPLTKQYGVGAGPVD